MIAKSPAPPTLILIGDSAESDSFIYLGIKLLLEGRLSVDAYCQYLRYGGVSSAEAAEIRSRYCNNVQGKVAAILIRELPGKKLRLTAPLTDPLVPFENFFEMTLWLVCKGMMAAANSRQMARHFHNRYGMTLEKIISQVVAGQAWMPETGVAAELGKLSNELEVLIEKLSRKGRPHIDPLAPHLTWKLTDQTSFAKMSEVELLAAAEKWWSHSRQK